MFNLYGNDRLIEWKKFRDSLETSNQPLQDLAELWSSAPFVNSYLNPLEPNSWPDPWHLVLDGKFDELAICLGMLYTLKLTKRFMDTVCEIHSSMLPEKKTHQYFLVVDGLQVLNYDPRQAVSIEILKNYQTNTLWLCKKLP